MRNIHHWRIEVIIIGEVIIIKALVLLNSAHEVALSFFIGGNIVM